jgi:energy-converting hydrogenase Eha subunit A
VTEFRDIPLPGRVIIIAIAVGVFAVAGVAVATSYNAVYRLVESLGLYGEATNKTFGMMLDIAFIIAELAAILGGILRAVHLRRLPPDLPEREVKRQARQVSRGWPANIMLVCGTATIAFNVFHAFLIGGAGDPKTVWRCVVAAFPPVLMMLSFQVLIAITKWVMLTIGRPLYSAAALSPTTMAPGYGAFPGYGPGASGQPGLYGQMPTWAPSQIPQNGQPEGGGNGELEATKRRQVEAYLAALSPDQLGRLDGLGPKAGAREITPALNGQGLQVSVRYVQQILDEFLAARRQAGSRRKH